MTKPYTVLSRVSGALTSEFVHGTDDHLHLVAIGLFPSSGGYIIVRTADSVHIARYEYTGVSTNDLTGLTQTNLTGDKHTEASYTFPAGSIVELADDAMYLTDLRADLDTWIADKAAGGRNLSGLGLLSFQDPTELAIASGAVTLARSCHTIQPESGTSDNLDTINTPAGSQILFLRRADSGDAITVTESGNVLIEGATTFTLPYDGYAMFVYDDVANKWRVSSYRLVDDTTPKLVADLDFNGFCAQLDPTLGSDHTYSGLTVKEAVGESVAFPNLLYFDLSEAEWKIASPAAIGTMPVQGMALESKGNGEVCKILLFGYVRDDSWAWTADDTKKVLYASTSGAMSETAVSTSGYYSQAVAMIRSADKILFNPSIAMGKVL